VRFRIKNLIHQQLFGVSCREILIISFNKLLKHLLNNLAGVGNQSLMLPIPATIPEGFKLLIKQCWSTKAKNRPSFRIILSHLEIACAELLATHSDSYYEKSVNWKKEVSEKLQTSINNSTKIKHSEKVS
jgi:hypothetical protein